MTGVLLKIVVALSLALPAGAQGQIPVPLDQPKVETPAEVDFSGVYEVWGLNPDFTEYVGYAQIVRTGEAVYAMRWQTAGREIVGVGIVVDGILAVSVHGASTVVVYKVFDEEGCLSGVWTGFGDSETRPETLTKLPAGTEMPEPKPRPSDKPTIKTAV